MNPFFTNNIKVILVFLWEDQVPVLEMNHQACDISWCN